MAGRLYCIIGRPGEPDQADRLFRRAPGRSGDTAHRQRHLRTAVLQCAIRHFAHRLFAHCAMLFQRLRRNAQHLFLGGIGIGHETAIKPGGAARDTRDRLRNAAAGTGLSSGYRHAVRLEQRTDLSGQIRSRPAAAGTIYSFCFRTLHPCSPRARSFWISTTASSPTPMRIRPSLMPAAARASGEMRACVVVAGWVIVVLVSPRLAVMDSSLVLSITRHAAALPPFTSNATMPPPVFCCFIANWCCGCEGRPG